MKCNILIFIVISHKSDLMTVCSQRRAWRSALPNSQMPWWMTFNWILDDGRTLSFSYCLYPSICLSVCIFWVFALTQLHFSSYQLVGCSIAPQEWMDAHTTPFSSAQPRGQTDQMMILVLHNFTELFFSVDSGKTRRCLWTWAWGIENICIWCRSSLPYDSPVSGSYFKGKRCSGDEH